MLDQNKHKAILSNILKDIYKNKDLGLALGFKGGTACYLFYELPRFSTDLDFNLLNQDKIEFVYGKIQEILSNYGVITDKFLKQNTIFLLLTYAKEERKVKIEISKRDFEDKFEIVDYFGVSIKTMKKEYIFAHKLVAISDRKKIASRDLFDIDYFLKMGWDFEQRIIETRTGKTTREYLEYLIDFINKEFDRTNILDGLGEVLSIQQKDYVREHLKNDVIFKLKLLTESLKKIV